MGRERNRGSTAIVVAAAATLLVAAVDGIQAAAAAKYGFTGDGTASTGQTWNAAGNWTLIGGTGTGGPPPTPADVAEFDSTDDKNLPGATIDTGVPQSVLQLVFGESGRALSQSIKIVNNTITLGVSATGTSPTTLSRYAVGVQTIASNVLLGTASQTWNLANSNANTPGSVVVTGTVGEVTAGSGISKQGAGTLQLNGANTFSGVYATRGGITIVGNNSALGSNATTLVSDPATSSDASLLTATGITLPQNVTVLSGSAKAVTLGGNTTQAASTWNGTVSLNQAVSLTGGTSGTVTFNGPLIDGQGGTSPAGTAYTFANSNVTVTSGSVVLAGANTYSGTTTVAAGKLVATAGRVLSSGGALLSSSTGIGGTTVTLGTVLAGSGGIGDVVVNGAITAGSGIGTSDSIGTLTTGAQTWGSGGSYVAKVAGASGDQLVLSGLTVASGFSINIVTGDTTSVASSYILAVDRTGTAGTSFDVADLNAHLLLNGSAAPSNYTLSDVTDTTGQGGDDLVLSTVAAPEPASLLLASLTTLLLAIGRRRRRATR